MSAVNTPLEKRPVPKPASTQPAPPIKATTSTGPALAINPKQIAVALTITNATRSVANFTLSFRIAITNNSKNAIRTLGISAQLTSAQRAQANTPSSSKKHWVASLDRIDPQQSQVIEASAHIPMKDMRVVKQGQKSVFIPLLHIFLQGDGIANTATNSFVIGLPKDGDAQRLYPIAFHTAPGPVRGLRANKVKPFNPDEAP